MHPMRRRAAILIFLAASCCPLPAAAQSSRTTVAHSGDYLALVAFGAYGEIDDVSANTGTPTVRNGEDGTGGVGLALGYNWAKKGIPIRTELEFHHRFRFDFDVRIPNQAGYENNLQSQLLLANAYYDFETGGNWTLYGGGGIGWARHMSEVDRVALLGGAKTERDDTTDSLAWNLAVGAVWQVAESWDIDFRYRFVSLGEISSGPHSDGTTVEAESYYSHDFLFALVYRF